MGFIQDNTCKGGDVEGVMDLTEIEDMLNELVEENEQLRKELDNFKPVIFQDMQKGTVILYSKGDIV